MNLKKPKILVLGSLNMDLVVRVRVIPRPGETVIGGTYATYPGGKGANQAVALARMGADVTMIGRVGADAFGDQLLENLRVEGIHTEWINTSPNVASGVALITVEESGQNNIAVASGANLEVSVQDVTAALHALPVFDLLVINLEVPLDALIVAAQTAKRRGARVVLNPAPAQKLPEALLTCVDVIAPNEFEAATLSGIEVSTETHPRQAAQMLHLLTRGDVVITLGERGALVYAAGSEMQLLAPHPVHAVDTTAAGDAFVGGLAVGLGEGKSLLESARLGNAAGAIAVTRPGAQPSLPRREEAEKLLQSTN